MNWKQVLGSGATSGALVAIMMLVLLVFPDEIIFGSFAIAILSFLSIILISALLTRKLWEERLNVRPSLTHLIPISFLTFILPVFGATFGGPDIGEISYWLMLPLLAAVGGAFWSLPFAGLNHYRSG